MTQSHIVSPQLYIGYKLYTWFIHVYSSHQKCHTRRSFVHYLRYVARKRERKIEASCTLGSRHLSRLVLSEFFADGEWKIWNVFCIFFSLWLLFEAPRNRENSSQDGYMGVSLKMGGPLIALFMGKIRETDGEAVDGKWLNSPDFSGAQSMANTSRAMSEIPYNSEYQIAIFGAVADVGPVYPGVRMEKQPLVYNYRLSP